MLLITTSSQAPIFSGLFYCSSSDLRWKVDTFKAIYLQWTGCEYLRANAVWLYAIQGTACCSRSNALPKPACSDTCEILLSGKCCTGSQISKWLLIPGISMLGNEKAKESSWKRVVIFGSLHCSGSKMSQLIFPLVERSMQLLTELGERITEGKNGDGDSNNTSKSTNERWFFGNSGSGGNRVLFSGWSSISLVIQRCSGQSRKASLSVTNPVCPWRCYTRSWEWKQWRALGCYR